MLLDLFFADRQNIVLNSFPIWLQSHGSTHKFKCKNAPYIAGGSPDFKWQGSAKASFGFRIHDFGIFWGKKILASIFSGSL